MTTPNKTISTESLQHEGRTFPPSPEVVKHALLNAAQFNALYERSLREPEKFWLEQARTLEWFKPPTVARKFTWDTDARKIQHTWFEDGELNLTRQLPRPPSENARQPDRHHLAGRAGGGSQEDDLRGIAPRSLQVRQRAQIARRQKGRPRGDLPADDRRGRRRDARLHPHRRHPFHRVRRVQRGFAVRPHQRFHLQAAHHGERLVARRKNHPAQRPSPTKR